METTPKFDVNSTYSHAERMSQVVKAVTPLMEAFVEVTGKSVKDLAVAVEALTPPPPKKQWTRFTQPDRRRRRSR